MLERRERREGAKSSKNFRTPIAPRMPNPKKYNNLFPLNFKILHFLFSVMSESFLTFGQCFKEAFSLLPFLSIYTMQQVVTKSQVMIIWDPFLRWPVFDLVSIQLAGEDYISVHDIVHSREVLGSHAVAVYWCSCTLFLWHYCVLLQRLGVLKGYPQFWQKAQGCSL